MTRGRPRNSATAAHDGDHDPLNGRSPEDAPPVAGPSIVRQPPERLRASRRQSGGQEQAMHASERVSRALDTLSNANANASDDTEKPEQDLNTTISTTYLPLFRCALCSKLLEAPTTLHCGHTVCAKHVRTPEGSAHLLGQTPGPSVPQPTEGPLIIPSCPLPDCRPTPQRAFRALEPPNIPSTSSVAYFPPLLSPNAARLPGLSHPVTVPAPKLDVTVSRLLNYLVDASSLRHQTQSAPDFPSDDDSSEDEDAHDGPGLAPGSVATAAAEGLETRGIPSRGRRSSSPRSTRPAKRRRGGEGPQHPARRPPPPPPSSFEDRFSKDLIEQLTCEICFVLLYHPVTTPCQHTFCSKCLHRSLDNDPRCPTCRRELPPFIYFHDHPCNEVLLSMILKAFPDVYEDRRPGIEAEERNARLDTPIFVCQLSFPGVPILLQIFEPRYRLMLRRCLEKPRPQFGMIMDPANAGGVMPDYGTMLEIRSVQMLPDGRSMVETCGTFRFRILERGTLDGYMIGRIERVEDIPSDLEEDAERLLAAPSGATPSAEGSSTSAAPIPQESLQPTNEELMAICHAFLDQLRHGTAPWVVQKLNNTYGPMPTDVSNFSFWMASVLPIGEVDKAKLLYIRSPHLRLRLIVHWIEQLNSNWWFSSGCNIC